MRGRAPPTRTPSAGSPASCPGAAVPLARERCLPGGERTNPPETTRHLDRAPCWPRARRGREGRRPRPRRHRPCPPRPDESAWSCARTRLSRAAGPRDRACRSPAGALRSSRSCSRRAAAYPAAAVGSARPGGAEGTAVGEHRDLAATFGALARLLVQRASVFLRLINALTGLITRKKTTAAMITKLISVLMNSP